MNPWKVAVVVLTALLLQVSLFSRFSFEGARPDVMVLVAVVAGFVAGPEKGAIVGFVSGAAFDVVLSTPFGLSALVFTIVGYLVGATGGNVLRASWWIAPVVCALGSAAGMMIFAVVGAVLGEPTFDGAPLATIVVVVSVANALLAPLAVLAMRWARLDDVDTRHQAYFAR